MHPYAVFLPLKWLQGFLFKSGPGGIRLQTYGKKFIVGQAERPASYGIVKN